MEHGLRMILVSRFTFHVAVLDKDKDLNFVCSLHPVTVHASSPCCVDVSHLFVNIRVDPWSLF